MDPRCLKKARNVGDSSYFNSADTHPCFGYVLQKSETGGR